jgi:tellurite resistance protein
LRPWELHRGCNKAVGRVGRRRELAEGVLTEAAAAMAAADGVLARELW